MRNLAPNPKKIYGPHDIQAPCVLRFLITFKLLKFWHSSLQPGLFRSDTRDIQEFSKLILLKNAQARWNQKKLARKRSRRQYLNETKVNELMQNHEDHVKSTQMVKKGSSSFSRKVNECTWIQNLQALHYTEKKQQENNEYEYTAGKVL